jgi:hypothetical protein
MLPLPMQTRRFRVSNAIRLIAIFGATALIAKALLPQDVWRQLIKLLTFGLGTLPPPIASDQRPTLTDVIECSAFAPATVSAGKSFFIQVLVHLHTPDERARAMGIATMIDETAKLRSIATLLTEVARGQKLAITFDCPELEPNIPVQEAVWRGQTQAVSFRVTMPQDAKEGGDYFPTIRVSIDGAPVGMLQFAVSCRDGLAETEGAGKLARRYQYAFLSYASQDRAEVTKFARALNAAKIDFFQDFIKLRSGEEWETRLYEEIDKCDVFYLFWSEHSAKSEMVQKEAERAHQRAANSFGKVPDITPIRLDASPLPTHPPHAEWMGKIHFDDYFRKLIENP